MNLSQADSKADSSSGFLRELGLFDSIMIVIGTMIGSGIFIVPAEMARVIGSSGWLLVDHGRLRFAWGTFLHDAGGGRDVCLSAGGILAAVGVSLRLDSF